MFGRKTTSLGKPYLPNLTIHAICLLPVDLSRSAVASHIHPVTVWRASLRNHHRIGSLRIEQEDASGIHRYIAPVTKTPQVQLTYSTPLLQFNCPITGKSKPLLPVRVNVKKLVSVPARVLLIHTEAEYALYGMGSCLV
jgi:hypothetical protein